MHFLDFMVLVRTTDENAIFNIHKLDSKKKFYEYH